MLTKSHRLTKNGSYAFVYKKGVAVHAKEMTLLYVANSNASVRVGFLVNNKVGKAVVRNKLKRRMRAFVATQIPLMRGSQCVFIVKPAAALLSYESLCAQMERLLRKAALLRTEQHD